MKLKVFFATVDTTYHDDGFKLAVTSNFADAATMLRAAGCTGETKEIPGLWGDEPERVIEPV